MRIENFLENRQISKYYCPVLVDFKKAFDSISHDKLWVTMMDMGYPLQSTLD